jgi:hypothetical protein
MNAEHFFELKGKYGQHASFAIWSNPESKNKAMVGDLSVFEGEALIGTLPQLHTRYILIGLNVSRSLIRGDFANFHDDSRYSQDYKLRYALNGSALWGAYITDIFKDLEEVDSRKIMKFVNENNGVVEKHIESLRVEIIDAARDEKPKIIAMGGASYRVLKKYFSSGFEILKVRHYAHQMQLEDYKAEMDQF